MYNPLFRKEDFQQLIWRYSYREGINLEVVGDLAAEIESMWFLNQTRIFDSIDRNIAGGLGMNTKKELLQLTYEQTLTWYRKVFTPQNMVMLTHGDFHPVKIAESFRKITDRLQWKDNNFTQKDIK